MTDFRVTLLGTGVPIPSPDRFGPSTLVEAGDQKFLIDAGRGATIRLYQLKIPIGRIDAQLLTHYHSDHTSCLPDVWLTGWLESHFGTRKTPYKVIGPTGAEHDLAYTRGVPAVVNNDRATSLVRRAATELLGPEAVVPAPQSFGADDFAWYLQHVPGTYFRLGTTTPGTSSAHDLHAGRFDVDEDCIAVGVRLLVATTLEALRG